MSNQRTMPNHAPSTANQPGLSENAAGGLAYITVIPAIIFLFVAPYNKNSYIRFHSWQCLLLAAAWAVTEFVIYLAGSIFSFLGLIGFGLAPMVSLATLILWLMLLIKAFNGERYKLPVIGDIAEKQSNG